MKSILKKIKSWLILVLLIAAMYNSVSARVLNIVSVDFRDTLLTVKHDAFGDIQFKRRIFDSPPRLVFDILEGKLGNKSYKFHPAKNSDVSEVRVSQFDANTVRVVAEAKSVAALEKIKIENIGQNLFFRFTVPDVIVQNVALEGSDLRVTADGPLTPRNILLDNPERLVVDLIGARLGNESQAKKLDNAGEIISVSQFDKSIVRMVFTGLDSQKREVRISSNERQLLVLAPGKTDAPTTSSASTTAAKNQIAKLQAIKLVSSTKDETVYSIDCNDKFEYKFLKLHDPERLVIDLISVNYPETLSNMTIPDSNHVTSVRFGLATTGKPITRVVFDIKGRNLIEEFKESVEGKVLLIRILGLPDKKAEATVDGTSKSAGSIVIVDAGHGGYDHGAIYGGVNEKDLTLDIAKKVVDNLEVAGIRSYMTRSDDRFVALAERVEISNSAHPDAFVSIHCNALATNPKMEGLQTYFFTNDGRELGEVLHKHLLDEVGMPDQRLRKAGFWVIKHTKSPSVLLELGFMTSDDERRKLARDSYQNDLAKAITKGIVSYLEGKS